MRKLFFSVLIILCVSAFSVKAQNSRVSDLATKLQQNIGELADRSAKDYFSRTNNNRDQVNNLLVSNQLRITIEAFLLLVKNNRPNSELRDAADSLDDRSGKLNSDDSNKIQLQQLKKDIEELQNELKKSDNSSDNKTENRKPNKTGESLGKLYWQGNVDDEVHLIIRGNIVQAKTISGTEYNDAIFNFTSPLPSENVQISVNKKDGRGTVKVIQQPSSDNNFTAIVQILDKSGGAREYVLEISWTK